MFEEFRLASPRSSSHSKQLAQAVLGFRTGGLLPGYNFEKLAINVILMKTAVPTC